MYPQEENTFFGNQLHAALLRLVYSFVSRGKSVAVLSRTNKEIEGLEKYLQSFFQRDNLKYVMRMETSDMDQDKIKLFEDQPIRTAWDEGHEEWYFSIVDVIAALTERSDSRHASTYWAVLKKRLKDEGADQLLTNCKQLRL